MKSASGGTTKTDNNPRAMKAKALLRRHVLEHVSPARVFDAFCGLGEMHRAAWIDADDYVGCDLRWSINDDRRRFVADNRRVLRSIDLQSFNVFDFDAYGGPWEQMLILAARRTWAKGERGAVVTTDGSNLNAMWGQTSTALAQLLGLRKRNELAASYAAANDMMRIALVTWLRRANVQPIKMWQAHGGGTSRMLYSAVVFEGIGA